MMMSFLERKPPFAASLAFRFGRFGLRFRLFCLRHRDPVTADLRGSLARATLQAPS